MASRPCADCAALRADFDALRDVLDRTVPALITARREREHRGRVERMRALAERPAREILDTLDGVGPTENAAFRWDADLIERVLRETRGAGRKRARDRIPMPALAAVVFERLLPRAQLPDLLKITVGRAGSTPMEIRTPDIALTDDQAARAREARLGGLFESKHRKPWLRGWDLFSAGGDEILVDRRAWAMRVELCPSTARMIERGVIAVSELTEVERRAEAHRRWHDGPRDLSSLPDVP